MTAKSSANTSLAAGWATGDDELSLRRRFESNQESTREERKKVEHPYNHLPDGGAELRHAKS